MRVSAFACVVWLVVCAFPMRGQAADYIDLGLEKVDVYTGSLGSTDFVTIKPIALLGTVRNYSNIAIDGFTLTPKIVTYYEGALLGPANGAFFFQPNYINNAPYTSLSIGVNGTSQFHADMTSPKAGHYRCVISIAVGGSIAGRDSNSTNNQTVVEFDVRQEVLPKPDLAIENVRITPSGDTFQVAYDVKNKGADPAQSVFDMTAKLYVILGPTTITTRTDVFRQHDTPLAPGASVSMGPFVIRDSRAPNAGLANGSYTVGIMTVQGCNYESNVTNNSVQSTYNFTGGGASGQAAIDLGIEKTDVYNAGNMGSSDLTSDKSLVLLVTVKNYSSMAIDGFTLTPKVETYLDGTLLGPANGAFYFQPNFINSAPYTNRSIDLNGTYPFSATISAPKSGHYLCNISYTLGGSIAGMDSNSANNSKTIEFDVRQVALPKPDLAIDNVRITKTADTFQVAYAVHNIGTDPAQSVFDMKAKIYVGKNPTTITTREDIFQMRNQPLAPGASVSMGPFVIRDARTPGAGLSDGTYTLSIFTTQGCQNDADVYNNRVDITYNFWVGGGDYAISGVNDSYRSGGVVAVSYQCALAQANLKMGFFSVNESGINPRLGSQAVSGTSGTLQFTAPDQGRYLFKIYDTNGHILASSPVFSITRSVAIGVTAPSSDTVAGTSANSASSLSVTPGVLNNAGALNAADSAGECTQNLTFKGISGYHVEECYKRNEETVILMDEAPASSRNLRLKGEKTYVKYVWTENGRPSPNASQVKSVYMKAANQMGAKVLVDRPDYSAFEMTVSKKKTYASVETSQGGRVIVFISAGPETTLVIPRSTSLINQPKPSSILKKRSAAMETYDETDRTLLKKCAKNLMFSELDGYAMDSCSKGRDQAVILLDENPDSERNLRLEGQMILVRYAWPEDAGDPPGDKQIRSMHKSEAKTMGAKVIADRPGYTAFEIKESGKSRYVTIGIEKNGHIIQYMSIEPDTVE